MTDWLARWKSNKIGWHRQAVNEKLVEFIDCLQLNTGERVFVPLCGKSQDMIYLLNQGFQVVGVELSQLAIEQFFKENNLSYSVTKDPWFVCYQSENITLYCGNYFDLNQLHLDKVCAVYDRAALVALNAGLREKYAQHLYSIISKGCRVLLLTLNYPQSQMSGPPFAVDQQEVMSLYNDGFECQQLQCYDDIKNEPKFLRAGVDFIEKATYCLRKTGE